MSNTHEHQIFKLDAIVTEQQRQIERLSAIIDTQTESIRSLSTIAKDHNLFHKDMMLTLERVQSEIKYLKNKEKKSSLWNRLFSKTK